MKTFFSVAVLFVVLTTSARAQLNSGPDAGASVAPLRIAVVTGGSRVVASLGYRSLNETNVPEVVAKLPPAK